jgi:hypothetical protein
MPNLGSPVESQAARVIATTISEYTKKVIENTMAKYIFLAMLRKKGRIRKVRGGTDIKKVVKHKRAALSSITDLPSISFTPINRHQPIELPARGYKMVDAVTLWQKYMNAGPAAIINATTNLMTELLDDFEFKLGGKFYVDGYAQSPGVDWHGVESLGGVSVSAHADTRILAPSDTYAGYSTAFGTKGTWPTGTFPDGDGSTGYHFFSPLMPSYKDSGYGGTTDDFKGTCLRVFRQAGIWQELRGHKIDTWLGTGNAFGVVANVVEAKEQIRTERSKSNSLLINLGFGNIINFEGTDITYERGVPGTDGTRTVPFYGFTWDQIELFHWGPQLFMSMSDFSIESLADRHLVWTMSNLYFNPQSVVKVAHTTTDGTFPE